MDLTVARWPRKFSCKSPVALLMSLSKSQFPHKPVNLFFILVIIKDKLTSLCGNSLLQTTSQKLCMR